MSLAASAWLKPNAGPAAGDPAVPIGTTGAEVRTAQGQTCQTPCSLAVVAENQSVTFTKNGFVPQTVPITVSAPAEHSWFARSKPPTLMPNPVGAALKAVPPEVVPPPKPVARQEPPADR